MYIRVSVVEFSPCNFVSDNPRFFRNEFTLQLIVLINLTDGREIEGKRKKDRNNESSKYFINHLAMINRDDSVLLII